MFVAFFTTLSALFFYTIQPYFNMSEKTNLRYTRSSDLFVIDSNTPEEFFNISNGLLSGFKSNVLLPESFRLVISSETPHGSIRRIGVRAFANISQLHQVVISEGISEIASAAFKDCPNLSKVELPPTLVKMGSFVFKNCTRLLPNSVRNRSPVIFDWWVANHIYLTKFPKRIESMDLINYRNSSGMLFGVIALRAFANCDQIQSIRLSRIREIDSEAFANCTKLKYVRISERTTEIGNQIFKNCPSLTSDGVINNSVVLFDWWIKEHDYCGTKMAHVDFLNISDYRNSAGKPFNILSSSAIRLSSRRVKITDLIIPEEIYRISGRNFFPPFELRRLFIFANDFSCEDDLKFHSSKHIKFYVASNALYEHLLRQGINASCIYFMKNRGDFFIVDNELVSLTTQGKKTRSLEIPPYVNKITAHAFNDSDARIFDFTKIQDSKKFTIEGTPFAGLTREYKVKGSLMVDKLIQAGACGHDIQNIERNQRSRLPTVIVSLSLCLPICVFLTFGLINGISFYKNYKQQN